MKDFKATGAKTRPKSNGQFTSRPISRYELNSEDAAEIRSLAQSLSSSQPWAALTETKLRQIALASFRLPKSIHGTLTNFRLRSRPVGGFVISGTNILREALGPTPSTAQTAASNPEISLADTTVLLLSSVLGSPLSYPTIQNGSVILDIHPVAGHETTQLGSSSSGALAWHSEEAFQDLRPDWLLLMCLRNDQQVATTFARIDDFELPEKVFRTLFEERFRLKDYLTYNEDDKTEAVKLISVLSGDLQSPHLRIDPEFMEPAALDPNAGHALKVLIQSLESNLQDVILQPGDILVIDNLRAVHGRRAFAARYDGLDRWLRVVNVTTKS